MVHVIVVFSIFYRLRLRAASEHLQLRQVPPLGDLHRLHRRRYPHRHSLLVSDQWSTIRIINIRQNNTFDDNFVKMPSKWKKIAHNCLICFFQHNYLPTFEQWSLDRVCVLSTWFGDICGSRRDLYVLQTDHGHFMQTNLDGISNVVHYLVDGP